MIRCRIDGIHMICDRCKKLIRIVFVMPEKVLGKYRKKKIFCGKCVDKRRNL